MTALVARKGGGKGGGGGSVRSAVEAPNTLRSRQHVRTLHAICEGEIAGIDAVYFDDVPVIDANGTANFNAAMDFRLGTQWQSAIPMIGLESENPISVQLKAGVPIEHAITDLDADAVRLTVSVPQLYTQNTSNGDISGATVEFKAEVRVGAGAWADFPIGSRWVDCGAVTPPGASGINGRFQVADRNQEKYTYQRKYGKDSYRTVTGYRNGRTDIAVDVRVNGGDWTQVASKSLPPGNGDVRPVFSFSDLGKDHSFIDFTAWPGAGQIEARLRVTSGSGRGVLQYASAYMPSGVVTISDKTMSRAQLSFTGRLPDATGQPRYVRVTRLTPDSTSSALQNALTFDAVTWLWDERLRYPNTVMAAISTDAEQFNSIPRVSFDVRGLLVRVPSNYDPISRSYTGSWDGTFKRAWSDNPAWCWHELVTNTRFGLGEFVHDNLLDKWGLYSIARYCDELVPDGYGGVEPRFTCNLYLGGEQKDAWAVVRDLMSVFRAIAFWSGGVLSCVQDAPKSARYLFTNANVVGGDFAYQSTQADQRFNVASVAWNDPKQQYKLARELVERNDLIVKWGRVQQVDLTAIGCTSRGQARRLGRWALFAETEAVTFSVGADGAIPLPGDVVDVVDANRAGMRMGGRLLSGSTASVLNLDAPVDVMTGGTCTVGVLLPDGSYQYRTAALAAGSYSSVTLDASLSAVPSAGAAWCIATPDLVPQQFRVVAVAEADDGTYAVSGIVYDPDKFDQVDFGAPDDDEPTETDVLAIGTVIDGKLTESLFETPSGTAGARVTLSWSTLGKVAGVHVVCTPPGSPPFERSQRGGNSIDIDNVAAGAWRFELYPVNLLGMRGKPLVLTAQVSGLSALPAPVDDLRIEVSAGTATLSWRPHPDLDVILGGVVSVRHARNTSLDWGSALPIAEIAGRQSSATVPFLPGKYLVRAIDSTGNVGPVSEVHTDGMRDIPANVVATLDESAGGFAGAKTGCTTSAGYLRINAAGLFDDMVDIDAAGIIDDLGGSVGDFEYRFAGGLDLASVQDVRVSAALSPVIYRGDNWLDDWPDFDAVTNTDGVTPSGCWLRTEVRTTQSDPALGQWSGWSPFVVTDLHARAFEFRLIGHVETAEDWIEVRECAVTVDMPDRVESGNDVAVPVGGLVVIYSPPFVATPALSISAQGMSPGDYADITSKSKTGFTVTIRNASGVAIAGRSIDWLAKGY